MRFHRDRRRATPGLKDLVVLSSPTAFRNSDLASNHALHRCSDPTSPSPRFDVHAPLIAKLVSEISRRGGELERRAHEVERWKTVAAVHLKRLSNSQAEPNEVRMVI